MRLLTLSACIAAALVVIVKADEAPVAQSNFASDLQSDIFEDYVSEPEFRGLFLMALDGPTAKTPRVTMAQARKTDEFFKQDEATIRAALESGSPTGLEIKNKEPSSYLLPASDEPSKLGCEFVYLTLQGALASLRKTLIDAVPFLGGLSGILDGLLKTLSDIALSVVSDVSAVALGPINLAISALLALLGTMTSPIATTISTTLKTIQSTVTLLAKCIAKPVLPIFGLEAMTTLDVAHCGPLADIYRQAVIRSAASAPKVADSASDEVKRLTYGSLSVLDLMDKSTIAFKNENLLATRPIFAADLLQSYREELVHEQLDADWSLYAQMDLGAIVSLSNALEACLHVSADPVAAADDLEYEYE